MQEYFNKISVLQSSFTFKFISVSVPNLPQPNSCVQYNNYFLNDSLYYDIALLWCLLILISSLHVICKGMFPFPLLGKSGFIILMQIHKLGDH